MTFQRQKSIGSIQARGSTPASGQSGSGESPCRAERERTAPARRGSSSDHPLVSCLERPDPQLRRGSLSDSRIGEFASDHSSSLRSTHQRPGALRIIRLAFRTTLSGVVSVVAADSPAQAKYRTLRSARDAGYRVEFTDLRCRRAPEFDEWAELDGTAHPWDPKLVPTTTGSAPRATTGGGE